MKSFWIGFKVEVASRFIGKGFLCQFNESGNEQIKLLDLNRDGKIVIEKIDKMLIVHGQKTEPRFETGLANFSLLAKLKSKDEGIRIIKIINVLGNDRLIRERISAFVNGRSMLSALPELAPLKDAFIKLEEMRPGLIKTGWYYAPEASFGKK